MEKNLNELLITKIENNLPENIKPVSYLMDALDIGRDTAYRRLRNEIPFTLDEISKISLDLGISLDELVRQNITDRFFINSFINSSDSILEDSFLVILQVELENLKKYYKAKETKLLIAMNKWTSIFSLRYDSLFKFSYYKWYYQHRDITLDYNFSEITIPDEILSISKEVSYYHDKISNNTFIVDRYMFLNTIREIQYYYKRKLISEVELQSIQKDILDLIHDIEMTVHTGVNETGSVFHFYLFPFGLESNSSNIQYDDNVISYFFVYSLNPFIITNKETVNLHIKWLEGLLKYSTLISKSNELIQTNFFQQQYEYANNMVTTMY